MMFACQGLRWQACRTFQFWALLMAEKVYPHFASMKTGSFVSKTSEAPLSTPARLISIPHSFCSSFSWPYSHRSTPGRIIRHAQIRRANLQPHGLWLPSPPPLGGLSSHCPRCRQTGQFKSLSDLNSLGGSSSLVRHNFQAVLSATKINLFSTWERNDLWVSCCCRSQEPY